MTDGEDVANVEDCLLAAVDKSTSVKTLSCNECFLAKLIAVRITEDYASERCTTARIVNDLLDNSADVTVLLSIIEGT
jgi:hypothetical protein